MLEGRASGYVAISTSITPQMAMEMASLPVSLISLYAAKSADSHSPSPRL